VAPTLPILRGEVSGRYDGEARRRARGREIATIAGRVEAMCAAYCGVELVAGSDFIRICGSEPRGFDIVLSLVAGGYVLSLGGWHDEFTDVEAALCYMQLALAGNLRLKIECCGRKVRSWVIERRCDDDGWREEGFLIAAPSWWPRPVTTHYFQNCFALARGAARGRCELIG